MLGTPKQPPKTLSPSRSEIQEDRQLKQRKQNEEFHAAQAKLAQNPKKTKDETNKQFEKIKELVSKFPENLFDIKLIESLNFETTTEIFEESHWGAYKSYQKI